MPSKDTCRSPVAPCLAPEPSLGRAQRPDSLVHLPLLRPGPCRSWEEVRGIWSLGVHQRQTSHSVRIPRSEPALGPDHSHRNPYPRGRGQRCKVGEGMSVGLRFKPGPHLPQSHGVSVSCVALRSSHRFPCPLGYCQTPPLGSPLGFSQANLLLILLGFHGPLWLVDTLGCYLLEDRAGLVLSLVLSQYLLGPSSLSCAWDFSSVN